MERNSWFRALIILAVIAVGLYVAGELWTLIVHFGDIIVLFFLAWLLAFVLLPVVRFLSDHLPVGIAGAAAIVYIFLIVVLVTTLVLVVPLLITQISQLADQLPILAAGAPSLLRNFQRALDQRNIPVDLTFVTGPGLSQQIGQFGTRIVENSVGIASGIASGFFNFSIVMILSFYFVVDGDRILEGLIAEVPEQYTDDARRFVVSIDRTFGGFLRGTAFQAGILGIGTGIIMAATGLPYVLLGTLFSAVMMVIPFIGPLLAMVLPILIGIFSHLDLTHLLILVVALVGLQVLVMNIIAPKVMAESVGLHPLLVFLALLVGIKQAGLAGAIFGVPIVAVLFATVRIFLDRWSVSTLTPSEDHANANGMIAAPVPRMESVRDHVSQAIGRIFHSKVP